MHEKKVALLTLYALCASFVRRLAQNTGAKSILLSLDCYKNVTQNLKFGRMIQDSFVGLHRYYLAEKCWF